MFIKLSLKIKLINMSLFGFLKAVLPNNTKLLNKGDLMKDKVLTAFHNKKENVI